MHKAIGEQLTCVFVDHGMMRKNEAEQVVSVFRDHFEVPLIHVDAEVFPRASKVSPIPREAQDDRRPVHPRLRRGSAKIDAKFLVRARSTPT